MTSPTQVRIAVDIGGTFTDTVLMDADNAVVATTKTPTTPGNPTLGALDGARRVLQQTGRSAADIAGFIHGTTLATNALIERRGARVAAITTAGFRDILEIAYERRYSQYDINLEKPDLLVPRERCFTIAGRVSADGEVIEPLDQTAADDLVAELDVSGAQAVAVCLLHSYANPAHERRLRELLLERRPELIISLSSEVSPEAREFERLCTTIANAYIQPLMASYLTGFAEAFAAEGVSCPVLMMTAGGGMTTIETASRLPIRLVESGPAGGAILAARVAARCGESQVLSFDMGGTTAKLCLIDDFQPQTARQFEISRASRFVKGSGMPARIPVVEMIEIGAGGGSIASVDRLGRLSVGPQSAGSEPGPAAFGRGGNAATVTDADVVLGLIDPDRFADGYLKIDLEAAATALASSVGRSLDIAPMEAAEGISQIVDESMASAGRMHAVESGKDLGERSMIAFGGNGPLHATRVARRCGVNRIIVPRDPGVGSAVGFLFAPVSFETVRSRYTTLDKLDLGAINELFGQMAQETEGVVFAGAPDRQVQHFRSAFMRYHGQGHEIEISMPAHELTMSDVARMRADFEREYSRQFTRAVPGMTIEILNWALKVSTMDRPTTVISAVEEGKNITSDTRRPVWCDTTGQQIDAAVFERQALRPGERVSGPALVVEPQTTTFVSVDFAAELDMDGNLILSRIDGPAGDVANQFSKTQLQVMWNRLLAVVEEQGQALVRAAFSPIVRECGDISAGIFDLRGRMLAQAVTGTPGHINTMAEAVKTLLGRFSAQDMKPGDIYMTNDPWIASGHLNDFLLMMPVFRQGQVIGFTSCTSHLVDLGGLGMGPEGSDIYDEGLLIPPCKLVEGGDVNALLMDIVKANSREPIANEGDIYALIACCEAGAQRLAAMMDEFGLEQLDLLADYIIETSLAGTRDAIAEVPDGAYSSVLTIDGYETDIELHAKLTVAGGDITLDFDGTSHCSSKGINVPLNYAAAYSVFAMRCIIGSDIPNNAGSLEPFKVIAPTGCILNAQSPAPVAMRHTIGQLTPDLVYGCLHQALPGKIPAEGASCMYDLPLRSAPEVARAGGHVFAVELAHNGGTGARPGKDGLSATAFPSGVWGSQVEITESVAPVLVAKRELRPDSGGPGRYRGGLGQHIELRSANGQPFQVFLSVDRVKYPARGRDGGGDGAPGRIRLDNGPDLPGKGELTVQAGQTLVFETPGGGGFGDPAGRDQEMLFKDVQRGLVSPENAATLYATALREAGE